DTTPWFAVRAHPGTSGASCSQAARSSRWSGVGAPTSRYTPWVTRSSDPVGPVRRSRVVLPTPASSAWRRVTRPHWSWASSWRRGSGDRLSTTTVYPLQGVVRSIAIGLLLQNTPSSGDFVVSNLWNDHLRIESAKSAT